MSVRFDSKLIYPYVSGKCRVCGQKVSGRRRTFCSNDCVEKLLNDTDWGRIRKSIFERDKGICQLCGVEVERGKRNGYHIDHIVPVSKGGAPYDKNNLQLACPLCNLKKGAKEPDVR